MDPPLVGVEHDLVRRCRGHYHRGRRRSVQADRRQRRHHRGASAIDRVGPLVAQDLDHRDDLRHIRLHLLDQRIVLILRGRIECDLVAAAQVTPYPAVVLQRLRQHHAALRQAKAVQIDAHRNAERRAGHDAAGVVSRPVVVLVSVGPGYVLVPGGTRRFQRVRGNGQSYHMVDGGLRHVVISDGADGKVVFIAWRNRVGDAVAGGVPHAAELGGDAAGHIATIVERAAVVRPHLARLCGVIERHMSVGGVSAAAGGRQRVDRNVDLLRRSRK